MLFLAEEVVIPGILQLHTLLVVREVVLRRYGQVAKRKVASLPWPRVAGAVGEQAAEEKDTLEMGEMLVKTGINIQTMQQMRDGMAKWALHPQVVVVALPTGSTASRVTKENCFIKTGILATQMGMAELVRAASRVNVVAVVEVVAVDTPWAEAVVVEANKRAQHKLAETAVVEVAA